MKRTFNKFIYFSPFIGISWTKRYVRYRPSSIREILRRERNKNRRHKRPINLLVKETIKAKRRKWWINKPQRRNFNTDYNSMKLPITKSWKLTNHLKTSVLL